MSSGEPDKIVNPERRRFFSGLFRRDPEQDDAVPHTASQPAPAAKGVSRRKFLQTTGAVAASLAGAPPSALTALNQTFGIGSVLGAAQDNDAWLVEVTKLLDESWRNIGYCSHISLPDGAFYHLHFFPGVKTQSFEKAVALEAGGCADLLHILDQHSGELAKLNNAGRLPLTNNPLLSQIFTNASGTVARQLAGNFRTLGNADMTPLEQVIKPVSRAIREHIERNGKEATDDTSWQRRMEEERINDEKAWYAHWNK